MTIRPTANLHRTSARAHALRHTHALILPIHRYSQKACINSHADFVCHCPPSPPPPSARPPLLVRVGPSLAHEAEEEQEAAKSCLRTTFGVRFGFQVVPKAPPAFTSSTYWSISRYYISLLLAGLSACLFVCLYLIVSPVLCAIPRENCWFQIEESETKALRSRRRPFQPGTLQPNGPPPPIDEEGSSLVSGIHSDTVPSFSGLPTNAVGGNHDLFAHLVGVLQTVDRNTYLIEPTWAVPSSGVYGVGTNSSTCDLAYIHHTPGKNEVKKSPTIRSCLPRG